MNRKRIIPAVVGLLVVAAAVYLTAFRDRANAAEPVVSGTVEATEADLGFQLPGRIASVGPHEGDRVQAGDTLAMLDRTDLAARVAQARAGLAAARAGLLEMERGARSEELAQAREADSTATARLADAQRDFDRAQRLFQGGAVPRESFDKASLALDVARSGKAQADQQLKLVESGPRRERIAAQRADANARAAAEQVRVVQLDVERGVDQNLAALREAHARVAALRSAVAQSQEVERIEKLALDVGTVVQTDYLDAEAKLFSAQAGLIQARHAEIAARVDLARTLGELSRSWLARNVESLP